MKAVNRSFFADCRPGRPLQHLDQNPSFRVDSLQVLFEADRCLDLGFSVALDSILSTLPRERQTLLYSAASPPWPGSPSPPRSWSRYTSTRRPLQQDRMEVVKWNCSYCQRTYKRKNARDSHDDTVRRGQVHHHLLRHKLPTAPKV